MAFMSATAIIRSLAVVNLILAYYFLTSPDTISDHNLVFILGESMGLVSVLSAPPNPGSPPFDNNGLMLTMFTAAAPFSP